MSGSFEAGCVSRFRLRILFSFLSLAALALPSRSSAAVFTVTSTGGGNGSLAAAITAANATVTPDSIVFDIAGAGPHTIVGPFPQITQPLTIDGYSQDGASANTLAAGATNATLRIELTGIGLVAGSALLSVTGGPTVIRGLALRDIPTGGSGILVAGSATSVQIKGCFVGTDQGGSVALSDGTGIRSSGSTIIGGLLPADRNLVSANPVAGIAISGDGTKVFGNLIGTDADGLGVLGNGDGIALASGAFENDVGALAAAAANLITGNTGDGIVLGPGNGDSNFLGNNRIFDNGGLGIDLGDDGVTPNDPTDSDQGPNDLLNSFEITFARAHDDTLHVEGYQAGPAGPYSVDIFLSDAADPSGFGEGELHLTALQFLKGSQLEHFRFEIPLGDPLSGTPVVTALSSNLDTLDTSEFSRAVPALDGGDVLAVTTTLDAGAGSLRAAVTAANLIADVNTIVFALPGSGPATISLLSGLTVTAPLLIDGYSRSGANPNTTATGSNATPLVVLDGSGAGGGTSGITIDAPASIVRGLAIGGFDGSAVFATEDADGARIEGNFLGTDAAGATSVQNGTGVSVEAGASGVVIGGNELHHRNLISGNEDAGISNRGDATLVRRNLIGADVGGSDLPNGGFGILTDGDEVTIGAREDGEAGNHIQASGVAGVRVSGGTGTTIAGNRITRNGGLGIDLGTASGVTHNDVDDADSGPNDLQNFPEIDEIHAGAQGLEIIGSLDVPAGPGLRSYRIDVFSNELCEEVGFGEGANFLGAGTVELSDADEQFSFTLPVSIGEQVAVTTTATDKALGNTSEFSACVVAQPLCGDASGNGVIAASDALIALRTAVGATQCALCICDVNETTLVSATDAQLILRYSVGQDVDLSCPSCAG